jgi:maltose alpha-D-glucosyltransferase/alpha-amylase
MMQYGDEIGMGDDLRLPERECARTPMQWSADRHAGFSRAKKIVRPVIHDRKSGYQAVNVAAQRRDKDSLLNWTERMIRARKECPEIGWGEFTVLRTNVPEVLGMRYDWRDTSLLTLHDFSNREQTVDLKVGSARDGTHRIRMSEYAWRWFRVGAADTTLFLSDLTPEKLSRDA